MDPQTPDHKGPRPGWLALLLVWLLASLANASPLQNYRPLEQYLQSHPEQLPLMEAFAARVRAEPVPLQARQQQPVRIAMIYPAIQTSDYWRRSVAALERRLDALRIDYRLLLQYSSPTDSAELLAGQLREALDWQPDYLVFTLDALPHRHMIERLLLRQRPRLILQNITTPLQDWSANPPFLYVGFDHRIGTRLLAREMLLQAGPGARYSTLYFSHGYISQMRGGTFVAMAGAVPGTRALGSYYTDGIQARAREATLRELDLPSPPNLLFASSTDIALGAIAALRERNRLDDVIINGWGGGDAELEALARGELDLTVMRMNDDNGVAMAEAIRADLEQHGDRVPQVFSGDMVLLTRNTPAAELEALRARAFRYSGP